MLQKLDYRSDPSSPCERAPSTRLIAESGLFDPVWYLATYPDVAAAQCDPLEHYLEWGWSEGRSPGPNFDARDYVARYPETVRSNPLLHYLLVGAPEGRVARAVGSGAQPGAQEDAGSPEAPPTEPAETPETRHMRLIAESGLFDPAWYLATYSDVAAAQSDPLEHYMEWGWSEGRAPGPNFDARDYVARYPDTAGSNPLLHYLLVGASEGRVARSIERVQKVHLLLASGLFDLGWYRATYHDLFEADGDLVDHYLNLGEAAGRSPGPLFDSVEYRARYSSALGQIGPLFHFISVGNRDGFEAQSLNRNAGDDRFHTEPMRLSRLSPPFPAIGVAVVISEPKSIDVLSSKLSNITIPHNLYVGVSTGCEIRDVWHRLRSGGTQGRLFVSEIDDKNSALSFFLAKYPQILNSHEFILYLNEDPFWISSSLLVAGSIRFLTADWKKGLLLQDAAAASNIDTEDGDPDGIYDALLAAASATQDSENDTPPELPANGLWIRCAALQSWTRHGCETQPDRTMVSRCVVTALQQGFEVWALNYADGRLRHIGQAIEDNQHSTRENQEEIRDWQALFDPDALLRHDDRIGMLLSSNGLRQAIEEAGPGQRSALENLAETLCVWAENRPHDIPSYAALGLVPALRRQLGGSVAASGARKALLRIRTRIAERMKLSRLNVNGVDYDSCWLDGKVDGILQLLVAGLVENEDQAMVEFVEFLIKVDGRCSPVFRADEIGDRLRRGHWYEALSKDALEKIGEVLSRFSAVVDRDTIDQLIYVIGYHSRVDTAHRLRLNGSVIMPLLRALYNTGQLAAADYLSHLAWGLCGTRLYSEDEFAAFVAEYAHAAADAGRRVRCLSGFGERPVAASNHPVRVGFLTRGGNFTNAVLQHVLPIMCHLDRATAGRFLPFLYALEYHSEVEQIFHKHGISASFVGEYGSAPTDVVRRYIELCERMKEDRVDIAVWVHGFDVPFFIFGLQVAPYQVLFSQYLHPDMEHLGIDACITYGCPARRQEKFRDQIWRVVPSCLRPSAGAVDEAKVRELRNQLGAPQRVILGTLARAEKVGQPEYLRCVAALLREYPECLFLWTGTDEDDEIVAYFRTEGILPQTRYVGWVDVRLYCRVFDILLDTFPLANGVTFLEAMQAGTACVTMDNRLHTYLGRDIMPILRREDIDLTLLPADAVKFIDGLDLAAFPAGRDAKTYIAHARNLIGDPEFRRRAGLDLKRIFELIYQREELMGRAFVAHLEDLIRHDCGTRRATV